MIINLVFATHNHYSRRGEEIIYFVSIFILFVYHFRLIIYMHLRNHP